MTLRVLLPFLLSPLLPPPPPLFAFTHNNTFFLLLLPSRSPGDRFTFHDSLDDDPPRETTFYNTEERGASHQNLSVRCPRPLPLITIIPNNNVNFARTSV